MDLALDPASLYFGRIKKGETLVKEVKILAKEPKGLKFKNIKSENSNVMAKLIDDKKASSGKKIEVTLKAVEINERFMSHITIATNHPKVKKLRLGIRATIEGEITAKPSRLYFFPKKGNKPIKRSIWVRSIKENFKIKKATTTVKSVTLEVVESDKPSPGHKKEYKVEATYDPEKSKTRSETGKVLILTDYSDQPRLEVDVFIREGSKRSRPSNRTIKMGKKKRIKVPLTPEPKH